MGTLGGSAVVLPAAAFANGRVEFDVRA
jgi:hypothetical protein